MYLYEKQQFCTHNSLHYEIFDNCVKKCSKSEVAPRSEVAPSDGTYIELILEKSGENVQDMAKKSGKTWNNQGILQRKKSFHPDSGHPFLI